jgi:hypothetical protein
MKEYLAKARERDKARMEARRRSTYTLQLTGDQVENIIFGILLNRRLMDRGADQVAVDKRLGFLLNLINEQENTLPEFESVRRLAEEARELFKQATEGDKESDTK